MATIASLFSKFATLSISSLQKVVGGGHMKQVMLAPRPLLPPIAAAPPLAQTRGRYLDWRMWRDVKRRRMVKEYAVPRLRVNAIRRCTLLPREIVDIADRELAAFPRDSNLSRTVDRCVLTSRPRGVVHPHHVSRIMFRLLADYNKLSGVIRAKW